MPGTFIWTIITWARRIFRRVKHGEWWKASGRQHRYTGFSWSLTEDSCKAPQSASVEKDFTALRSTPIHPNSIYWCTWGWKIIPSTSTIHKSLPAKWVKTIQSWLIFVWWPIEWLNISSVQKGAVKKSLVDSFVSHFEPLEEDNLINLAEFAETDIDQWPRRKVVACELRMSWSVNWSKIQNEYCMVESRIFNSLLLHMLPLENTSISYILLQLLTVFTKLISNARTDGFRSVGLPNSKSHSFSLFITFFHVLSLFFTLMELKLKWKKQLFEIFSTASWTATAVSKRQLISCHTKWEKTTMMLLFGMQTQMVRVFSNQCSVIRHP